MNDDLEYKIGITGLLRGGGVVVIIGILYLVGLALSQGWITPQLQFGGELALCFGLLTFGFLKRNVREEFGHLMMGLGSCGLYCSFAGGHVFKDLYTGKVVVALFLLLSLANLGFALWRGARSFWAIGMVGGFLAAALPMHESKQGIAFALHFAILVPAALIVVRHRWPFQAVLLWVLSTCALIPALTYGMDWTLRVACLYANSLLCAWACASTPKEKTLDPAGVVGWGIFLTGAFGLVFNNDHGALVHIGLLGLATAGLATLFANGSRVRAVLLGAAVATVTVLAPVGLALTGAAFAYTALAILAATVALRTVAEGKAPKSLVGLAWIELGLALGASAFAVVGASPLPSGTESGLLVLLMISAALCATANRTVEATVIALGLEGFAVGGTGLLIGGLFLRLIDLALPRIGTGASHTVAVAFGALLFASLCAATSLRAKWAPAAFIGAVFAAIGVGATLCLSGDLGAPGTRIEVAFLLGSIAVLFLSAFAVSRVTSERAILTGSTVLPLWALLSRTMYVLVAMASNLTRGSWGLTFAWIGFAAALIAIGFRRDARYLRYWGVAVFATTVGKVFLVDLSDLNPAIRVAIILALGFTMIGCGYWYIRAQHPPPPGTTD